MNSLKALSMCLVLAGLAAEQDARIPQRMPSGPPLQGMKEPPLAIPVEVDQPQPGVPAVPAIAIPAPGLPAVPSGRPETPQVCSLDIVFEENPRFARALRTPVYKWIRDGDVKACVLLLHPFPMHGRSFDVLARHLAKQGYAVYAADMRGFGATNGGGRTMRVGYTVHADSDVALLAAQIKARHPDLPLYCCGESMGGALAVRLAAMHPDLVDGLILSGPGLKLCRHYLRLLPSGTLNLVAPRRTEVDFSEQIRKHFSTNPKVLSEILSDPLIRTNFDTTELLQCKVIAHSTDKYIRQVRPRVPVLVLQDLDDEMVCPSVVTLLKKELRSRDLTIEMTQGRGHVLLATKHIKEDMLKTVTDWLNARGR